MLTDRCAARFRVRGRVQGVGFRAAARRQAQELDLHGYAVNQADGSVELIAEGAPAAVDAFEQWLHRGPVLSRIDAVDREETRATGRAGFGVG
jgi:acylphosphatase